MTTEAGVQQGPAKTQQGGWGGCLGIALLLALIVLVLVKSCGSNDEAADVDYKSTAWTACKNSVTQQLKAPAPAEFPPITAASFAGTTDEYTVTAYVDAQNSYGAQLRTNWTCTATWRPATKSYTAIAVLHG